MEQVENCNDGFTMRELTHADLEQFNALLANLRAAGLLST